MQTSARDVVRLNGTEHDLMAMARAFPQGAVVENMGLTDQRLTFDNSCVKGVAASVGLHFGMRLNVSDFRSRAPLRFGVEHAPTQLEFAFCRGQGSRAISDEGQTFDFGGAEYRIGRIRETTHFDYSSDAGAVDRSIQLSLSPDTLRELLGARALPSAIDEVLTNPSPFSLVSGGMDARMHSITDEILECSTAPALQASMSQHLFLESKAMELVAVLVDRVADSEERVLCRADLDRIHRARELLRSSLSNPPSVAQLARHIGMGERRFKVAFKQTFGFPVMSYARKLRLDHARQLLTQRSYNVTEVAHRVGYSNPSKFAAAYRKQFGVAPSAR